MNRQHLRLLLLSLALLAFYVPTGMLGLHFAATGGGYAGPVWLPTGFAIAAVLLFGRGLVPAIWIGAFVTNFFVRPEMTWQNFALASAIATGNCAEALLALALLKKFKAPASFLRLEGVAHFIQASVIAPIASATIGVAAVSLLHDIPRFKEIAGAWMTWWIGDVLGALIVVPLLITLLTDKPKQRVMGVHGFKMLYPIALLAVGLIIFPAVLPGKVMNIFIGFALYSVVVMCAFTLPLRRLFVATASVAAIAITRAYMGHGMFGTGDVVQRLALLQFFLGCISVLVLLLNAVVSERLHADDLAIEREKALMRAEKMSALGEMASGIAHEIGNPLMAIYARTEQAMTLLKEGETSPEVLEPILKKIDSMAERIDQIVKSVRFFSRKADRDPFCDYSLNQILDDTLDLCREQFRKDGVQLIVDGTERNLSLECKPVLLAHVLLNLLNNARDAALESEARWVKVSLEQADGNIKIVIQDSGSGIPLEIREEIFHPFFTTKDAGKGTGLGLSISRSIAETHNGSISLDPEGPHTKFVIDLPIRQPRAGST